MVLKNTKSFMAELEKEKKDSASKGRVLKHAVGESIALQFIETQSMQYFLLLSDLQYIPVGRHLVWQ